MATPPEGFGAHDRTPTCLSNFEQLRNAAAKVFSLHVIGVSTKRFIAPREVLRIRARPTPATELRHMNVINFGFRQRTLRPRGGACNGCSIKRARRNCRYDPSVQDCDRRVEDVAGAAFGLDVFGL